MTEMLLGMILGAILFCALQLLLANDKLDSLDERLYSIQLKCTRIGNRMPHKPGDENEENEDQEESTDV